VAEVNNIVGLRS